MFLAIIKIRFLFPVSRFPFPVHRLDLDLDLDLDLNLDLNLDLKFSHIFVHEVWKRHGFKRCENLSLCINTLSFFTDGFWDLVQCCFSEASA